MDKYGNNKIIRDDIVKEGIHRNSMLIIGE